MAGPSAACNRTLMLRIRSTGLLPLMYYSKANKPADPGPEKNFIKKQKKLAKKEKKFQAQVLLDSLTKVKEEYQSEVKERTEKDNKDLTDLVASMKVFVDPNANVNTSTTKRSPDIKTSPMISVNRKQLFAFPRRLGVFKKPDADTPVMPEPELNLTEYYLKKNVEMMMKLKPLNAFEEKMQDYDQMWQYPIDNEACNEEENKYGFEEHVLLNRHLKGFPEKGPVRHFMELVLAGLSKNPYYTVEEKLEYIDWYREYFSKFNLEELKAAIQPPIPQKLSSKE